MGDRNPNISTALGQTLLAAANNANIGVSIVYADVPNPSFVYVGEAAAAILARPMDELMSQGPFSGLTPKAEADMRSRRDARLRGEVPPKHFETEVVAADGRVVPLEVHVTDGTFAGRPVSVSFFQDITGRTRIVKELASSEARFRQLIESAPDPVWIFDGRGLRFVNPAAVRLLGYPDAATLLASDPRQFVAPGFSESIGLRTREMLEKGRSLPPMDYPTRRHDGSYVDVEVASIPIDFEGARALLSFGRDVTARKRLEEHLAQAERVAALGTMAAGMAHEINNPLTYLTMGLDVARTHLAKATPSPGVTAALNALGDASDGARRLAAIIGQMRAFSRSDQADPAPERVDVIGAVESAIKMARHEILHRARLVTRLAAVPAVMASGPGLEQVFVNLLVNAAQALPDGPAAEQEIEVSTLTDADGRAVVEVRDTGSGIPEAALGRIFEPFFTTKTDGRGTGLGLAICHRFITGWGGTISARPAPGRGTILRVVLPPTSAGQTAATGAGEPVRPTPVRRRVLVVDDEETLATMIGRLLGDVHDVTTASSAAGALALIAEHGQFDAILCDLMMPGTSGMDLFSLVSERHPHLERRFVFMTGGAFTQRAARFLERPSIRRIDKPMPYARLLDLIEEAARA